MVNDISNKKLAGLLAISIVISIAGTFYSIDKIANMSEPTGFAVDDTGSAAINISSELSLIVDVKTLDWGTGIVNTSKPVCTTGANLTTGDYDDATVAGADENDCWTGTTESDDFVVRSLSNVDMYPKIQGVTADTFFGVTGGDFQYGSSLNNIGCTGGSAWASWQDITAGDTNLCNGGYLDAFGHSIYVPIRLHVPTTASGEKNVTIIFTASDS
ncbi:hypothetical protein C0585_01065 [Candidatus Woesearchaeota archaeon]|nr:MAG: hypothetical protein C0585_01065 [Candidatus Woesearchaeota archaeon]